VAFGFTGKEFDEETGLYYFGARYYDARTSVWVSADPILDKYLPTGDKEKDKKLPGMGGVFNSFNLGVYGYGHLNPVKFVDPNGKQATDDDPPGGKNVAKQDNTRVAKNYSRKDFEFDEKKRKQGEQLSRTSRIIQKNTQKPEIRRKQETVLTKEQQLDLKKSWDNMPKKVKEILSQKNEQSLQPARPLNEYEKKLSELLGKLNEDPDNKLIQLQLYDLTTPNEGFWKFMDPSNPLGFDFWVGLAGNACGVDVEKVRIPPNR